MWAESLKLASVDRYSHPPSGRYLRLGYTSRFVGSAYCSEIE